MYTTDEWGNTVFHILTGKEGIKMFKEAGITNTMSKEEYKKHIDSHNKIQAKRNKEMWEQLEKIFKIKLC